MKKLLLYTLSLAISACGSTSFQYYSGSKRPDAETTQLSMWVDNKEFKGDLLPEDLKISSISINGDAINLNGQISILPGKYEFKVKCDLKGDVSYKTYKIDAEAGKHYAVIAYAEENKCKFKKLNLLVDGQRFQEL